MTNGQIDRISITKLKNVHLLKILLAGKFKPGEIMKYLVKLIVIFISFTMTTELFAQGFILKGGLNLSNMLIKDENETHSEDHTMKPGFHLGAIAEIPLSEIFSLETGFLLSTKGYRIIKEIRFMGNTYKLNGKMNLLYLDIPLAAKATFDIGGGTKIYGVFGPYLGTGLAGKYKSEETYNGTPETYERDIKWGSDEEKDFLHFDFGLTMGAGVEINSILIGLNYGLGLTNISPYEGFQVNNRVLGLSVGYKFGGK